MVERNLRLCWLKDFLLDAFLCLRDCVGRARGIFCSWTTRLSPFFSPPISLIKVAAFLTTGAFSAFLLLPPTQIQSWFSPISVYMRSKSLGLVSEAKSPPLFLHSFLASAQFIFCWT